VRRDPRELTALLLAGTGGWASAATARADA
jgi:hypothetical protein